MNFSAAPHILFLLASQEGIHNCFLLNGFFNANKNEGFFAIKSENGSMKNLAEGRKDVY